MSINGVLWTQEKKRLIEENDHIFNNFIEIIGPDKYKEMYDETIEQARLKHLKRSLEIAYNKIYEADKPNLEDISHLWICIQFSNSLKIESLKDIYERMEQMTNKYKWCSKHAYTLECHTDKGYRPHIHLMAITKERPNKVITRIAKYYDIEPNFVHCKAFHKGQLYGEHLDYILGDKKEEKQSNVKNDNDLKINLGIPLFTQNIVKNNNLGNIYNASDEAL